MSNRSDKKKQEQLNSQQVALNAEASADRSAAREKSPLQAAQEAESLGWFNFLKDPGRDFSKAPMPFDVSEDGAAGAEAERTARGFGRFGASAVDPNLQLVLATNERERKAQRRGEALERAVSSYDAKMRAQAGDVSAQDAAGRMAMAGMTTSAGANALNNYAAFQPRAHWGLQLATAGIGALGSAFSGPRQQQQQSPGALGSAMAGLL